MPPNRKPADTPPAQESLRQHHLADEAGKQAPRALALRKELLFGPGLSFLVGLIAVGAFLLYVGFGLGTALLGGLIAGISMAVLMVSVGLT